MKTSRLKPFRKTAGVLSATIFGTVLMLGVYWYLFHTIEVSMVRITSLQGETKVLEDQEAEVGQLKKSLAETQVNQQTLASYLIDTNDVVPFFETFEGYGTETDTTVKFNNVNLNQSPTTLVVSLTSDGSFADVYRFLALVEAAPYEFSIVNATVSSTSSGDSQTSKGVPIPVSWEADLTLSITGVTSDPSVAAPATVSLPAPAPVSPPAATPAPTPSS